MSLIKSKIIKGDLVVVIAGDEKGKKGEVIKVYPKIQKLLIKDLNMLKKHKKRTSDSPGSIDSKEGLIHISNVSLWDVGIDKHTKIGFAYSASGEKIRVSKRTKKEISK